MKLPVFFTLFILHLAAANAHSLKPRHVQVLHKRQASPPAPPASSTTSVPTVTPPPSSSGQSSIVTASSSSSTGSASSVPGTSSTGTGSAVTVSQATTTGLPPPPVTWTGIPPIGNITSGMPSQPTPVYTGTFKAGSTPPISGAPVLPSPFVFVAGDWPAQDKIPPTDSDEVRAWMQELEGFTIPDIPPTADGSCIGDPAAAADAANRGWWTCGGYTRSTDITTCPQPLTWGVSFDDGPAPYTQTLLDYLGEKDIKATFFVVGSRVIERPNILVEEYMSGHEISVHTWSHPALTSKTTEEIVAELGWARKAIKNVLGITPTTMRPPYGDIDDRVRAISMAMGMVPIMWTRTPDGAQFDTNDWRVAGGSVNGTSSFETFETILNNATKMDHGFIVLQHDLYPHTVDLAVGYTLNAALSHNPPFNLQPIGECVHMPSSDLYLETTTNKTFPYTNHTSGLDIDGDGKPEMASGNDALVSNKVSLYSLLLLGSLAVLSSLF